MTAAVRPEDFDYQLPEELIAQQPLACRSDSRLLVLHRESGVIEHHQFNELPALLPQETMIVWNNSKVIPARLKGSKEGTNGKAEVFLYRFSGSDPLVWEALVNAKGRVKEGLRILLPGGATAIVENVMGQGRAIVRFENVAPGEFGAWLERNGHVPLPPYIRRTPEAADRARYQTVYAGPPGAVAAPTAGLHFTDEIIAELKRRNIPIAEVTLHVSLGTFLPLRDEQIAERKLHREVVEVQPATAQAINGARAEGRRVLAVGTTTVRTLETVTQENGALVPYTGDTDIFIFPPYRFKAVDVMLTNFHLPQSSLLMLVCAFGGIEPVLAAYREAVRERYRFFSYGDAMLIL